MTRESLVADPREIAEKESRVRNLMSLEWLDALVLSTQANFAWFTCGGENRVAIASEAGAAHAVITPDAKYILCDNIEARRIADEEVAGQGFEIVSCNWWESSLSTEIRKLTKGSVGADTHVSGTKMIAGMIAPLRFSLTDQEIERYRWLGKASAECVTTACRSIRPGMTEHQVAGMLGGELLSEGIIPNVILIAADMRIAQYRHPISTEKPIEQIVMVVAGARKWGLIISLTRIVHFGPIPDELRRRHNAVVRVDAELIAHTRPGTSVGRVFRKGMEIYAQEGFADEWMLHHQGGPTGYAGRDFRAAPDTDAVVLPNQAFAWNPSITGTKSEDTVIALPESTEILSAYGDWPMILLETESVTIPRPDILEL